MPDIFSLRVLGLYRRTPTDIPDWSTESWAEFITAPNDGELNKFAVTSPTHLVYDISHLGPSIAVMMVMGLNSSGLFEVQWHDGLHLASQAVPGGGIMVIPQVSTSTALTFISSGGTYDFLLALAAP